MTENRLKIFEYLEGTEAFIEALEHLELSYCDHCEDYQPTEVKDLSRGCVGHPDDWEAPNIIGYCSECGREV
jgi:coenzyme F420-reducing hydrogenase beta subunit